jgi:hypothetical protein
MVQGLSTRFFAGFAIGFRGAIVASDAELIERKTPLCLLRI